MVEDLETPMFTQAQVLRMLPDLKSKTLQNWLTRGLLGEGDQKPGRQGRRKYTPIGVIILDFMVKVGLYGVPPSLAAEMSGHIAEAAIEFWASKPEIIEREDQSLWIPVGYDKIPNFRRARIVIFRAPPLDEETLRIDYSQPIETASYLMFVDDLDEKKDRFRHPLSIVIEVDYMIAMAINRMFLLEAGEI